LQSLSGLLAASTVRLQLWRATQADNQRPVFWRLWRQRHRKCFLVQRCPYSLTICGLAQIGTVPCPNVVHVLGLENIRLTCDLPMVGSFVSSPSSTLVDPICPSWLVVRQGTNALLPVTVAQKLLYSFAGPLLSYALPSLYSVKGCTDVGNDTTSCPRDGGGGLKLTMRGANFGAVPPKIIIGGSPCANVVQPVVGKEHELVTCILPPGIGVSLAILLIQDKGKISNDVRFVSAACLSACQR
jgi:hypothetical protein